MQGVNLVSNNIVNFKSNNNVQNNSPKYITYKTEATTGKKWGVGIASFLMPGVGQAINNQWGKGVGFFALGAFLPPLIGTLTGYGSMMSVIRNNGKAPKIAVFGALAAIVAALGSRIWATVDAVKNAKSKIDVPVEQ